MLFANKAVDIKKIARLICYLLTGCAIFTFSTVASAVHKVKKVKRGMHNVNIKANINSQIDTFRAKKSDALLQILKQADFHLFLPLYDVKRGLLFFEGGGIYDMKLAQAIINTGIGGRMLFNPYFAVGANAFFDYDATTSKHHRFSIGAEALFNYGKIFGNFYHPVEGGRYNQAPEAAIILNYRLRAATGFDIGIQGYLPQHPQVGAKVLYERYSGEAVAFNQHEAISAWQKNPARLAVGLHYTPVSAITLGAEYHHHWNDNAQDSRNFAASNNENKFYATLALTYRFGFDAASQFAFDSVNAMRRLTVSRYDFIERNHQTVLDFVPNTLIRESEKFNYLKASAQKAIPYLQKMNKLIDSDEFKAAITKLGWRDRFTHAGLTPLDVFASTEKLTALVDIMNQIMQEPLVQAQSEHYLVVNQLVRSADDLFSIVFDERPLSITDNDVAQFFSIMQYMADESEVLIKSLLPSGITNIDLASLQQNIQGWTDNWYKKIVPFFIGKQDLKILKQQDQKAQAALYKEIARAKSAEEFYRRAHQLLIAH